MTEKYDITGSIHDIIAKMRISNPEKFVGEEHGNAQWNWDINGNVTASYTWAGSDGLYRIDLDPQDVMDNLERMRRES
jgi:hypothetical protein